jgi:hypothetical protein
MMISFMVGVGLFVTLVGSTPRGSPLRHQTGALPFSCEVFSPTTSAAVLADRFGTANVRTAQVPWGGAEGDLNEGTVLFGAIADAKLEIYWRDGTNKRDPEWVSVRGSLTRWRSPAGITLGTPLRAIERLNGRPFRLIGFGSDVSGTVMNWSSGRLDTQDTEGCRVRVRVGTEWVKVDSRRSALLNQLKGEAEYSSGHPAMQALDPTVYEVLMQYTRVPANKRLQPTARRQDR